MEVRELVRRWQQDSDEEARAELVVRTLPLARQLARRYAGRGEPLEDLEQVASVGLLKAIDRYDAARGVRFSAFAQPTITGELKRYFRDRGWMMRVPRDIQELVGRIATERRGFAAQQGRAPTVAELAQATGSCEELVLEALSAAHAYRMLSLDEPLGEDAAPMETVGGFDENFDRAEDRVLLGGGLARLAPRERAILRLRYVDGLTQREIAARVGISQMHVSRLLRRSVDELRARIALPQAA